MSAYPLIALTFVLFFWIKYNRRQKQYKITRSMLALTLITLSLDVAIMTYFIPVANFGKLKFIDPVTHSHSIFSSWQRIVRSWTCVDLSYQVLITEQKNEYDTYWANLEGAHLEGANLDHTILKLANLRNAHLQGSNLFDATLRTAMLENADFADVAMNGADLSYAKLLGAKHLDVHDLCKARTLYKARLDAGLASNVKASCPSLFSEESQNW